MEAARSRAHALSARAHSCASVDFAKDCPRGCAAAARLTGHGRKPRNAAPDCCCCCAGADWRICGPASANADCAGASNGAMTKFAVAADKDARTRARVSDAGAQARGARARHAWGQGDHLASRRGAQTGRTAPRTTRTRTAAAGRRVGSPQRATQTSVRAASPSRMPRPWAGRAAAAT